MKRRWSLLLPTIAETLEDPSAAPHQLPPASPSTDDYMASIQALARPLDTARPPRAPRPRLFTKAQAKYSGATLVPRWSPRGSRVGGSSPAAQERATPRGAADRDCEGLDPVDWLYGQAQTRT